MAILFWWKKFSCIKQKLKFGNQILNYITLLKNILDLTVYLQNLKVRENILFLEFLACMRSPSASPLSDAERDDYYATSAIAAGEEIRTDYGEAYWEGLPWGWVAIANALIALRLLAHRRSRKPDV